MPAFLFTDIEASTRLWEEHPEEMSGALSLHDAILKAAVEDNGGMVVKTTGDGLLAVFPTVAGALAGSVDAQIGLGAASWGGTGPIRVRMGIHAGESEERDGDFFGPPVNRAARIMSAGHGGQILVSGIAVELVGRRLPDGVELLDLGVHRLKDLTLPERLFQVLHSGLGSEFPAPVTLDARPNNLPTQVSEFFGRATELASLQEMLADPMTRLITLTGPGGSGKTRLAIQVAAEVVDRYRDGVYFVDISQERQPQAVYEAMVRAIAVSAATDGEALQTLKTRLRDREMLIVLDNFEQVTEASSGVVELLQECPALKVVVTSREALRVRAERAFPVPPLALPVTGTSTSEMASTEAVQLFVDRARAVLPDFELAEVDVKTVADICARLDGLPLAIELAAARLNVFSPTELLERLRVRLDVIGAGSRDLPERQRTLLSTIDWSYDLLDTDECRTFELMSLFTTAQFTAIEEVSTALGYSDALESLASLVDKSLIRSEEAGATRRFSMLRTIREYAAVRLAEDPVREASARTAHAVYFTSRAQVLRSGLQGRSRPQTLAELEADNGNLRSAWHHWVEMGDLENLYLLLDGLWALLDAKGWYHTAIELAGDLLDLVSTKEPSPERVAEEVTLRTSLARALMAVYGWGAEVEETFRKIADGLEETDASAVQRFPVLRALATYYLQLVRFDKSAEIGRRILDLARTEGDTAMEIEGLYVTGSATTFMGNLDEGLALLDQAIARFDPSRHGSGRYRLGISPGVVAGFAAGLTRWQVGELDLARAQVTDALGLARELNHPFSLAYALYHFGFFSLISHSLEDARKCAAELMIVATKHEYLVWQALADVLDGVALTGMGLTDEGFKKTEAGLVLYQNLSTPPVFWPLILSLRAGSMAAAGSPEPALDLVEEAIELAGGAESGANPEFGVVRGDILSLLPEPDIEEIARSYRLAAGNADRLGFRTTHLQALTRLVRLNRSQGLTPDGGDELLAVYRTFDSGTDELDLVLARDALGIDGAHQTD
jgi:predicted ATPase/class 3 adenylate cyclase